VIEFGDVRVTAIGVRLMIAVVDCVGSLMLVAVNVAVVALLIKVVGAL
jgi:hypothetical protein